MKLTELRGKLERLKGIKEDLQARIAEDKVDIRLMEEEKSNIMKANKVLSYISQNNQQKIVGFFEHTLSSGLKDMFDPSYAFRFDLKTRGDSSSTDFEIHSSSFPGWSNILMCRGKSIQEIIAIIFRLMLVKLDNRSRKILILDEPSSGVENERQALLSKFLRDICDRFEIQLIIVTHSEGLCEWADLKIDIG